MIGNISESWRLVHFKFKWIEVKSKLPKMNTVDECKWKNEVKEHWWEVLARIITVLQYLSNHCPEFHGTSVGLCEQDSGYFLG
jgi:hypothetical protein